MKAISFTAVALLFAGPALAGPSPSATAEFGAVVDSGGKLLAGNAARVQINLELGGTYYVYFKKSVLGCVATTSVAGTGSTPTQAPAIATVAYANNSPTAIAVQIRDVAGKLVQRGFSLAVSCF